MIIKIFDNGWGPEFVVKQLEQKIVDQYLKPLLHNSQRVIVINSTWYTNDYHGIVTEWLRHNSVDVIVLVSLIDSAIPAVDYFKEFNATVVAVGYYPGNHQIDFWALFLDQYFESPSSMDMCRFDLVDRPFMCLNRKPHWHRKQLYNELRHYDLLDKGLVSMGSQTNVPVLALDFPKVFNFAPNAGTEQNGIPNDIATLGSMQNWQRHFLNIVTETVYDINANNFVSEKIYKPILGMRPFLVYDADGACRWLADRGFANYTEDFVDITDLDLKNSANIAPFLVILSNQSETYWKKKLVDLAPKIVYNKEHFYKYVEEQKLKVQKGIVCPT
jgi:hypothetical protein